MPQYRKQKNLTITEEQADYIKSNNGIMSISQLSKMLGLPPNKVQKNRELLGLVKPHEGIVVEMNQYFDVDKFARYYRY